MKTKYIIAVIAIIAACHVTYWNSLNTPFQFDDLYQIAGNIKIRDMANPVPLWQFSPKRFVLMYTYAFNYALGKEHSWNYHYTNLLIHACNAVLLFFLARLILDRLLNIPRRKGESPVRWPLSSRAAFLGALFFTVHPMLTESITYISGRSSSLCTMFGLIALLFYFLARVTGRTRRAVVFVALGVLSFVLAMFTKELAVAIPLLVLLVEYFCFFRYRKESGHIRPPRRALPCLAPFLGLLLLIVAYVAYRLIAFGGLTQAEGHISIQYALTQFRVIVLYLAAFVFPVSLNIDRAVPLESALSGEVAACMILIAGILAAAFFLLHRKGLAGVFSFAVFWIFISLLPASGILFLRDAMAERRMYLPSIGLFMLLGCLTAMALEKARALRPLGVRKILPYMPVVALTCVFGFMTVQRNSLYADRLGLWLDVRSKVPSSYRAVHSCGLGWLEHGLKHMREGREDLKNAALWNARRSLLYANRLNPEEYSIYLNLSDVETLREDFPAALRFARLARFMAEEREEYRVKIYSRLVRAYFFSGADYLSKAAAMKSEAEEMEKAGRKTEARALRGESMSVYRNGRDDLLESIGVFDATLAGQGPKIRAGGEYRLTVEYYYASHRLLGFYYKDIEPNPGEQQYYSAKWAGYILVRASEKDKETFYQFLFHWMDKIVKG